MHLQLREKLWDTNWKAIRTEVRIELMNNEFSTAGRGGEIHRTLNVLVFPVQDVGMCLGDEGTS